MIEKGKLAIIPPADREKMQAFVDLACKNADKTTVLVTIPVTKTPTTEKDLQELFSKIRQEFKEVAALREEQGPLDLPERKSEVDRACEQKSGMIPLSCHDCEEIIVFSLVNIESYIQCPYCVNEDFANKN